MFLNMMHIMGLKVEKHKESDKLDLDIFQNNDFIFSYKNFD